MEERQRILKMVEEGRLTAAEAEELLDVLHESEAGEKSSGSAEEGARYLRIRVEERGEEKVNISLPLALARSFLDFVPAHAREEMESRGIELDSLLEQVEGSQGTLVNIEDDDEHVEIKLE